MKKQLLTLGFLILGTLLINGQTSFNGEECLVKNTDFQIPAFVNKAAMEAKNGADLPPTGTIRVLVVFIEIDYNDPFSTLVGHSPSGTGGWAVGQLPNYKDDVFDPFWLGTNNSQGKMTKYYDECSFENYRVLGDYIDTLIIVKQTDLNTVNESNIVSQARS